LLPLAPARLLTGGKRLPELGPHYFAPTVLADANADMALCGGDLSHGTSCT
jgi:acyl-CoA reductase-like NAD-dependent aldehyde dehydrogenase